MDARAVALGRLAVQLEDPWSLGLVRGRQSARRDLALLRRLALLVDDYTADAVLTARSLRDPLSWADIGSELGVSRQAVAARFGELREFEG